MKPDDYDYWGYHYPVPMAPESVQSPVDWRTVGRVAHWLIAVLAWVLWLFFLVVPTINGSHGTDLYPLENNVMFVMTGLVLAMASYIAWTTSHAIKSALFALVILILSCWF